MEKLSALGQHQRIVQKKTEAEADAAIYRTQVQQWMNMHHPIALPQNALKKLAPPALADTAKIAATPQVRLFEQSAKAAQQARRALRHEFLPSITGGYFNKQIEGTPGYGGIELSLAMPLFFWAQTGRVQEAGREADLAQAESESRRIAIETLYQNRIQEFRKARQQLQWYEEQGLKIADALLSHADKSYRSGNLGYVEYIQGLDQALTVRTEYLESLNLYNQTVTDLQFFSGNFN